MHLNRRSSGWQPTPGGEGYWLVASDGGIFSFGDASSTARPGVAPQLAHRRHGRDPDVHGYWLVAADGGVFSFGDAVFHGSGGGDRSARRS